VPRQKTAAIASSRDRLREAAKILFAERGFEATTTPAICRLVGTSQSQLIKHFTDKQGILEAVFEHTREQINPAVQLATEGIVAARDKLKIIKTLDGILKELAVRGEMKPDLHPQAFRSGLMGLSKECSETMCWHAPRGFLRPSRRQTFAPWFPLYFPFA